MYLVECSYLYDNFVKPWKVTLTEPYRGTIVETHRFGTDAEVINAVKAYKKIYKDKMITAEHVYSVGPRLDLVNIYD